MWVAFGGAIGAICRYALSVLLVSAGRFPWATLGINIAGSFLIGVCWGAWFNESWFQAWGRLFLVVGVLGGFTTFSAFSLETVALVEGGRPITAAVYVLASVVLCVIAAWLGQKTFG
jgi:CrcB protein|tara:strand:+ start:372 stop:722 length:351 start_codon:yes stop_codon:yes gene_type:complete